MLRRLRSRRTPRDNCQMSGKPTGGGTRRRRSLRNRTRRTRVGGRRLRRSPRRVGGKRLSRSGGSRRNRSSRRIRSSRRR